MSQTSEHRPQIVLRKIFFDWLEFFVTRAASRERPKYAERDRLVAEIRAVLPRPDFMVSACYDLGILIGSNTLTKGATRGPWVTQLMEAFGELDIESRAMRLVDWQLAQPGSALAGAYRPASGAKSVAQRDAERLPVLAPWLSGHWPVHNLEIFRDFWLNLSSDERALLRLAFRTGQIVADQRSSPILPGLVAAGWLLPAMGVYFSHIGGSSPIFVPDRRLRQLSYHQGELLS